MSVRDADKVYLGGSLVLPSRHVDLLRMSFAPSVGKDEFLGLLSRFDIEKERLDVCCLLAYLAARFPGLPPEGAVPRLRGVMRYFRYNNMVQLGGFKEIGAALSRAGIPVLVMKGMAMRHLFPELPRYMYDVDLAVPKDRHEEAAAVVRGLGFGIDCITPASIDLSRDGAGADVHSRVIKIGPDELSGDIWARARRVEAFGVPAMMPVEEDMVFQLMTNFYSNTIYDNFREGLDFGNGFFNKSILWMWDVAKIAEGGNLDWNRVVENGARIDALHVVRRLLEILDDALPGLLPDGFVEKIRVPNGWRQKRDARIMEFIRIRDGLLGTSLSHGI